MTATNRFLRPFLALAGLGLLGILSLIPLIEGSIEQASRLPGAPPLPDAVFALLILGQPTLLLLAAVALGVALAEKAGLTSLILRRLRGEAIGQGADGWGRTLLLAFAFAAAVAAADLVLRGMFPASLTALPRLDDVTPAGRMLALFYGGITEELMMRFGLMTLLLWLGLLLTGGRGRPVLVWFAIGLTAFAFAAGHLGAVAGMQQMDNQVLIARILVLNGVLGLLFGWLYASRSLEHAMLAHAASHVTFWGMTPVLARLGQGFAG
ncbi:CPBP family glutamic-type intramembrane protease [Microvirga splendida]|uniref:CPBP family intramembrane metalloprotease n=1 Tax=Microvirga splendida TaxID=2795727 RepID=A0ABS0Y6N9_9HYPH|nr:CPBP family glutamic-type intramembrane protease [Microvirga splendida]MBJ6127951.1 CPBP family intramembrane metalloprotease [Microvirga splendida]